MTANPSPSRERLYELFEFREVADEHSPRNVHVFWRWRPREDFATEQAWKAWNTKYSGTRAGSTYKDCRTFYRQIKIDGVLYREHRLIFVALIGLCDDIDHIDHNGLNNYLGNLRSASNQENRRNSQKRSDNTSGVSGVLWPKRARKWHAQIQINGVRKHLGYFTSQTVARDAVDFARQFAHGEFAVLNESDPEHEAMDGLVLEGMNSFEFAQRAKDAGLNIWTKPRIEELPASEAAEVLARHPLNATETLAELVRFGRRTKTKIRRAHTKTMIDSKILYKPRKGKFDGEKTCTKSDASRIPSI